MNIPYQKETIMEYEKTEIPPKVLNKDGDQNRRLTINHTVVLDDFDFKDRN